MATVCDFASPYELTKINFAQTIMQYTYNGIIKHTLSGNYEITMLCFQSGFCLLLISESLHANYLLPGKNSNARCQDLFRIVQAHFHYTCHTHEKDCQFNGKLFLLELTECLINNKKYLSLYERMYLLIKLSEKHIRK